MEKNICPPWLQKLRFGFGVVFSNFGNYVSVDDPNTETGTTILSLYQMLCDVVPRNTVCYILKGNIEIGYKVVTCWYWLVAILICDYMQLHLKLL